MRVTLDAKPPSDYVEEHVGRGKKLRVVADHDPAYVAGMKPEQNAPTLRELFPDYSDAEIEEAADRLARYLKHSLENYRLLCADPLRLALFRSLTAKRRLRTMNAQPPDKFNSPPS
jgi:hypothetical protein